MFVGEASYSCSGGVVLKKFASVLISAALIQDVCRNTWRHGWYHQDEMILQSQGLFSRNIAGEQQKFMSDVFHDTLGFAGVEIIRHIVGIAGVSEIRDIADAERRANLEKLALYLGKRLVVDRCSFVSIESLNEVLQEAAVFFKSCLFYKFQ